MIHCHEQSRTAFTRFIFRHFDCVPKYGGARGGVGIEIVYRDRAITRDG
jgi:hypothetical protein